MNLFDLWQKGIQDLSQTHQETPPLPTFKALDKKIWGLHKEELFLIEGFQKSGKSSFALNLAYRLADMNIKVNFITLEMSEMSIVKRLYSIVCGVDSEKVRRYWLDAFDIETLQKHSEMIKQIPLTITYGRAWTPGNLLNYINKEKPEVVFLDHIQMIYSFGGNKSQAIEEYIKTCKRASQQFNCAVVVCSQMTQELHTKKELYQQVETETGAWSRSLEQTADTTLVLSWNEKKDEYKIIVKYQREGSPGVAKVKFNPALYKFEDFKEAEEGEEK